MRTLTFVFACILCFVVSLGIVIAVAAGIAYGYNYSMAEFLTLTRQDVTVYMRRGQFYDKPDFSPDVSSYRRSGGDDAFNTLDAKKPVEYEDTGSVDRVNVKSLPDTWSQVKEVKKYAKVLKTFTRKHDSANVDISSTTQEVFVDGTEEIPSATDPNLQTEWATPLMRQLIPMRRVSMDPNPMIATTLMQSGSSHIIMRNFQPSTQKTTESPNYRLDRLEEKVFYNDADAPEQKFYPVEATRATMAPATHPPVDKLREKVDMDSNMMPYEMPMRHWRRKPELSAEYKDREDVDEDNVVYKPV